MEKGTRIRTTAELDVGVDYYPENGGVVPVGTEGTVVAEAGVDNTLVDRIDLDGVRIHEHLGNQFIGEKFFPDGWPLEPTKYEAIES